MCIGDSKTKIYNCGGGYKTMWEEEKMLVNPLPDMPILGFSNSAPDKDTM